MRLLTKLPSALFVSLDAFLLYRLFGLSLEGGSGSVVSGSTRCGGEKKRKRVTDYFGASWLFWLEHVPFLYLGIVSQRIGYRINQPKPNISYRQIQRKSNATDTYIAMLTMFGNDEFDKDGYDDDEDDEDDEYNEKFPSFVLLLDQPNALSRGGG